MRRKALLIFSLLMLCSTFAVCTAAFAWNETASLGAKAVAQYENVTIKLSAANKTLKKGSTFTLKSTVSPKGAKKYVRYTSSNTAIARVTQAGKVKGVSYGDAVISVSYGDQVTICNVTVTGPLKKIALNASTASIQVGGTTDLRIAAMTPFNAKVDLNKAKWTSSKPKIAKVSGGKVTALSAGKTKITAKVNGKSASCTVTVTALPKPQTPAQTASPANTADMTRASGALETQVLNLVNAERAKAGLSKLSYYTPLEGYALVRSEEITRSFSHTRPNGTQCFTAIKYSILWGGENIAMGFSRADDVMAAWMASPSHRSNILNKNFTELGVGVYHKNGTTYWVQMFTKKR